MIIHNPILTGSLVFNGTNLTTSNLVTTGSNNFTGSQAISGSLNVTGNITATTLVVQTVSSSVIYSSGSNVFGNNIANTQVMTGSVNITGSLAVVTNGTELQVGATGVNIGNALTDSHVISGSLRVNPNGLFVSSSGNIGIGTNTPFGKFNVVDGTNKSLIIQDSGTADTIEIASYSTSGGTRALAINASNITLGTGAAGGGSSTPRLTINSTGSVGIGTAAPLTRLQVIEVGGSSVVPTLTLSQDGDLGLDWVAGAINFYSYDGSANSRGGIGNIRVAAETAYNTGATPSYMAFYTHPNVANNNTTFGAATEKMRITAAGNVGIGITTPLSITNGTVLHINGSTSGFLTMGYGGTRYLTMLATSGYAAVSTTGAVPLIFETNETERGRFTSNGYFKARGSETSYYSATIPAHELRTGQGGEWNTIMTSTASDSYGLLIGLTPGLNNTGNELVAAYTGNFSTLKFKVASNGGIYNYTGNNVPLSDQRMKKEITPLESYWNKFKEIEMVKFKYIDQEHNDFNIGVVSQQIESIMPEFVDVWDERNIPEDGKPLMGVYMEDIHNIAIKVLQEAMAKIEELKAEIEILKTK